MSTEDNENTFKYISASLLVILSVATILLNSFCLDVIRRSRSILRKPSTIFIINLLVVQLIQGLIVLPLYVAKKANFTNDQWRIKICNGFRFSYMIAFFGTCIGVLLTSIDRFFAVYWITTYRLRLTKHRMSVTLFLCWTYTLVICVIPFFNTHNENAIVLKCKEHGVETLCDYHQSKLWTLLMLLINTVIPYVVIVTCYVYVIKKVKFFETRAHQRNSKCFDVTLANQNIITIKKKDIMKHKKITKLAIILCLAYAFLWMPSIIYYAIKHGCPDCFGMQYRNSCWSHYVDFIIKYVAFLNGIAVPIIYCFYQKDFRKSAHISSVRSSISDIEKVKLISDECV